ncbi:MAG TPA: hypothetical protein PLV21_00795 [Cyclobacteriaceae bacterium]|nr:hypothetical protein [Cyclobacteriaceae bacterium]HRJ80390.1 hypothetical protein [Cyclobacteriaceae bacterium]
MKQTLPAMRPQDIVVLLKILLEEGKSWTQLSLARALFMSQSEISASLSRSHYARLLHDNGRKVVRQSFMDLLQYGVPFVFPQQPGNMVRGVPTAHSAAPLKKLIESTEHYVWPYAKGTVRGHGIQPLFNTVMQAVELDAQLYELLALVDAVRVGKVREKNLALDMLRKRIC